MKANELKRKLKAGIPCVGPFIRGGAMNVEIIGRAGWDFCVVDMEHGVHSVSAIPEMQRAADAVGLSTVVRVPEPRAIHVMRALDAGGQGVQVPQITTIAQVEEVARAARYAPLGNRGSCSYVAAAQYSLTPYAEHMATSNEEVLTVVHVENKESAEMIDEILAVPGVDVVFCGPWDLSQSLGIPGQTGDPRVKELIRKVARATVDKGRIAGMHIDRAEQMPQWLDAGITYITCCTDVGLFARQAKSTMEQNRAAIDSWKKACK